jgi:hypothetical protein
VWLLGIPFHVRSRTMSKRFTNYGQELLIRHVGRHGRRITLSDGSMWEFGADTSWISGQRVVVLEAVMDMPAVRLCNLDVDSSIELEGRPL